MKVRYTRVNELANSYLNGCKGFVRDKVKKLNKAEFCMLVVQLVDRQDNVDEEEMIHKLTLTD